MAPCKRALPPCYRIQGNLVDWDREAEGYRLPTEAEWEYAVRAGTATRRFCGDTEDSLGRYAWYTNNSGGVQPVGQKEPNPWGLLAMMGNVWGWCWVWFGDYSADTAVDPVSSPSGSLRVLRGGAVWFVARNLRSAYRGWNEPESRDFVVGFRGVRGPRRQP